MKWWWILTLRISLRGEQRWRLEEGRFKVVFDGCIRGTRTQRLTQDTWPQGREFEPCVGSVLFPRCINGYQLRLTGSLCWEWWPPHSNIIELSRLAQSPVKRRWTRLHAQKSVLTYFTFNLVSYHIDLPNKLGVHVPLFLFVSYCLWLYHRLCHTCSELNLLWWHNLSILSMCFILTCLRWCYNLLHAKLMRRVSHLVLL